MHAFPKSAILIGNLSIGFRAVRVLSLHLVLPWQSPPRPKRSDFQWKFPLTFEAMLRWWLTQSFSTKSVQTMLNCPREVIWLPNWICVVSHSTSSNDFMLRSNTQLACISEVQLAYRSPLDDTTMFIMIGVDATIKPNTFLEGSFGCSVSDGIICVTLYGCVVSSLHNTKIGDLHDNDWGWQNFVKWDKICKIGLPIA